LIKGLKEKKENAKNEIKKTITKLSDLISDYYSIYLEAKDNVNLEDFDDELKFSIETIFKKNEFQENYINSFFDRRSVYKEEFNYLSNLEFTNKEEFKEIVKKIILNIINEKLPKKESFSFKEVLIGLLKNWFIHNYKVEYQGDKINDMSPGKKSFVLLRLLIDLDNSKCPILIDQPEDDLDNRSIYSEVVRFLRKKKTQRQIIIATHNPNLVLGSDAEQIIVANQEGKGNKNRQSVKFDYVSGSIEHTEKLNPLIEETLLKRGVQEHICEILEGGQEAFEKRKNKYNF
jgi:hypothetical protein